MSKLFTRAFAGAVSPTVERLFRDLEASCNFPGAVDVAIRALREAHRRELATAARCEQWRQLVGGTRPIQFRELLGGS